MREQSFPLRQFGLLLALFAAFGMVALTHAQSQEPKPAASATPVSEPDVTVVPAEGTPVTGVTDSSWHGPNWGVSIEWDPAQWTVEGELIDAGYDGLQIGTPSSTVYVEAYEGFSGDAEACLVDAEEEIRAREGVTEVTELEGRDLPERGDAQWPTRLFGLIAELPDGTPYRGVEYVQCRTIVPGTAVLELTWQSAANVYNQELPLVETLLGTLTLPGEATPQPAPAAPQAPTLQGQAG